MAEPHVLSALKRRYAQTLDLAARGIAVGDDLEHLAAVILMFAPDTDLEAIKPKRRIHPRAGRWTRAALDVLKQAERPMTARELADAVLEGSAPNRRVRDSVTSNLHATMGRLEGKGVERAPGTIKRWRLA
jgi:hypothetical protein